MHTAIGGGELASTPLVAPSTALKTRLVPVFPRTQELLHPEDGFVAQGAFVGGFGDGGGQRDFGRGRGGDFFAVRPGRRNGVRFGGNHVIVVVYRGCFVVFK